MSSLLMSPSETFFISIIVLSMESNDNPLQYSCLEISMDRGAWRAIIHEVPESDMTEHTRMHTHSFD